MPGLNRILVTTDAVGGVWRYSLDLAHGFARNGTACTIAVLGPRPSPAQAAEAHGLDLVADNLPLDWTAETSADLDRAADWIAGLARDAASVHLHAPALARRLGCPVIAVAHSCVATWWRAVYGGQLPPDLAWRSKATAAGLAAADAVIAPSRAFAHDLAATYPASPAIQVVHNGRDEGAPKPTAFRSDTVLTAGRLWDAGKNIAVLEAAAATIPIRAAGALQGPTGTIFRPRHLVPLGHLPDLTHEMATTAVFAAPSLYEPFGLAVLEAAAHGMALVLSDIPTFRELWDGAALFVRRDDPQAWTAALHAALADPAPLAAAARARAAAYPLTATVRGTHAIHDRARLRAAA